MTESAEQSIYVSPEERHKKRKAKQTFKRMTWIFVVICVLIPDQISKWFVMEVIFRPETTDNNGIGFFEWYLNTPSIIPFSSIKITSFFNVVMAWNTGVSFSMFSGHGEYMAYILILVALAITVMFARWMWQAEKDLHGFCYALIIGGALGNVIDRARFGAVIDFLDFHLFGYHWPAFNIADMAVVMGIGLLVIVSLFFDIRRKYRYRSRKKRKLHR